MNWEIGIDMCTPMYKTGTNRNVLSCTGSSAQCCDDLEQVGRGEVQERADRCTHMADSLCCIAETNTAL